MKKFLSVIMMFCIAISLFAGVSTASAADQNSIYKNTLKVVKVERTDVYAIDYYKYGASWDDKLCVKWANKITKGIDNDYEKARAIFNFVVDNTRYAYGYDDESSRMIGLDEFEKYGYMQLICEGYASTTQSLLNAAGLPAKKIDGVSYNSSPGSNGLHAWNEVYVDNRWVYVDSTWAEFDLPVTEWAKDHSGCSSIMEQDGQAWNGSLYIWDSNNDILLKEIRNFPLNSVVKSTYGFDIKDMYTDADSKKPFKLNTLKVNSQTGSIYVDSGRGKAPYSVTFNIVDNDGYEVDYDGKYYNYTGADYRDNQYYIASDNTRIYSTDYGFDNEASSMFWYFYTPANAKIKKPIDPVRKGYTFIGWYNADTNKKWNFATDKVTAIYDGMRLVSHWQKAAKSYKVTFNTNKGASIKTLTIAKDSTVTKPKDPTRKGYNFLGWYKDSKCSTAWNFTKDKVTATTTIYAKWEKAYEVTFKSNGGTAVFYESVKADTVAHNPIMTVRSGYEFTGWYKDAECATLWDFATNKVSADTTLYAGWQKK